MLVSVVQYQIRYRWSSSLVRFDTSDLIGSRKTDSTYYKRSFLIEECSLDWNYSCEVYYPGRYTVVIVQVNITNKIGRINVEFNT